MAENIQGGEEGQGRDRAFEAAGVAQQAPPPPGSEISDVGNRLQERQVDEPENSGAGMILASSIPNKPAQLIMEGVWLPWCEGREIIEFVGGLKDLSKETFEV
ncbi:hypothetical protein KC19_7G020700 [Ceratodon purpureus]|uniref:Uncharacterized protein n=1 Tax=Ceratodon purpureus TaxID=3225 RepID=A0A8T0H3U6_CERPU|nr:hypothetical protein KC19_7G019500 [Ceratodon purpureus]KAG0565883.1 hypothetical protein KC19_7G020700 [Ceratodon purpureus]